MKSYWAEIRNLSWIPPNVLLAPILVPLWPSLISVFQFISVCNVFSNPRAGPKSRPLPLVLCMFVLCFFSNPICYIFSNSTAVLYMAATPQLRCVWSWICTQSEFKKTWYFDTNFNKCHDDFALRVKLRRHIRSGPPKSAPAICYLFNHYNLYKKINITGWGWNVSNYTQWEYFRRRE